MTDYIGDSASGLQASNVYVDRDATLADSSSLASELKGSDVAVVSLPGYATETLSANSVASQIRSKSDYKTVVVVVDGGTFGVSSKGGSEDAMLEAIYSNFSGDASAAIQASLPVLEKGKTVTSTSTSNMPGGGSDGVDAAIGVLSLAAVLIGVAIYFGAKRVFSSKPSNAINTDLLDTLPEVIKREMVNLDRLASMYSRAGEALLADSVRTVLNHGQELFARVQRKAGEQQYNMAAVEYADTFKKLGQALSEDYYYDIMKNPQLWTKPEERKREVAEAVRATDQQLIRNIQQVNANEDLEIQVALESLSRSLEDVTPDSIYKSE